MLCSTSALHFPAQDFNHHGRDMKIIFAGHWLIHLLDEGMLEGPALSRKAAL